jgi:hypothetical protein
MQDTLDFVAYVAKDLQDWRACYVLECGGGLAQDVITSIGQAFELRFKEFLTMPSNQWVPLKTLHLVSLELLNINIHYKQCQISCCVC